MLPSSRNYPGSASLVQDLGKKVAVSIRGGRMFIGFFRIIDQHGNIVLHQAVERIHVEKKFCDIPQGILLIKGDNVILIGELNADINIDDILTRVSEEEIYRLQAEQTAAFKELAKKRAEIYTQRGLGHLDLCDLMFDDG